MTLSTQLGESSVDSPRAQEVQIPSRKESHRGRWRDGRRSRPESISRGCTTALEALLLTAY